jgi:glycosyltransferase involved in cell wall biosynthesis
VGLPISSSGLAALFFSYQETHMPTGLVSAVMITGKHNNPPERVALAEQAIRCFHEQTYTPRELVIINDGPALPIYDRGDVRQILVPEKLPLGALRNIGLERARGEWIIQWDDDDFHHEDRIAYQMEVAKKDCACLLRYQVRYSFPNNSAYVKEWPSGHPSQGIPGTVLHPNLAELRYPEVGRGEDDVLLAEFFRKKIIVGENIAFPELYIRFFHGSNTWDHRHIMGDYAEPKKKNQQDLPPQVRFFLQNILTRYSRS